MIDQLKPKISCPLAIPALFFAAGIATGRHGPVLPALLIYPALTVAFLVISCLLIRRTKSFLQPLSIALVFFVIGNVNTGALTPPPLNNHLKNITDSGQDGIFSGILRTAPAFNGSKGKFIVDVDLLWNGSGATIPINTRILFNFPFPPPVDLGPGERVLIRASLTIPTPPGTPGSFNYRQYLADNHIPITGFIRSPAYLSPLPSPLSSDNYPPLNAYLPQYLRYRTNLFIDNTALPIKIKALYKAIITGQRDSMPIAVLNNFKRSGAFHLLAISGMHLGLLALLSGLLINYVLRKSTWLLLRWPSWKIAALLTLMIMGGYALISGLQPPVVRAFIMASMLIGSIVLDRPKSLLNTLALAALLILFYEPSALFSVSFQLSFMAVTTIILFCQQFPELFKSDNQQQNLTGRIILWTRTGITVSFIALFATAPITLYHFHQVSLLGPLTTILTAPLICFWALPMGLTATLLSSFWPNLATTVLTIGGVGLRGADLLTSTLAAIPFTFHTLPPPPIITVTGYYLLAGYLLFCKSRRTGQVAALTTMILLINIPAHIFSPGRNNEEAIITFLDVGQGNSTLLELPGDKNILIDGGGSFSPIFDPGEQIIGPYLWHQSIRRLDALVISHAHHDHYNGLEFIIRNFKPKEVWVNGVREKSFGYRNILKAAAENGAKIRVPEQGTVLVFGGGAELTSISNMHLRNDPALPPNSRSLIIKLAMGGKSLILPGDMMAEDGRYLINQGVDLQSDILLAPHHGSKNSAGSLLVAKGPPKWLIVSASPFKADDFPAPDFAQWCIQQGINILNTATSGAIRFSLGKNGDIRQQIISEKSAKKQTGPG